MGIRREHLTRSKSSCELCGSKDSLDTYTVAPKKEESMDNSAVLCQTCIDQVDDSELINPNHWRCLNDSIWSQIPVIQVISWRMLNLMKDEVWPADLLEMMYLDEETLEWAKSTGIGLEENGVIHTDSNGARLQNGDSVTLTKTLNVKGSSIAAKRGTPVRNISLVADNAEHIEGRVNGQLIVILTKFVKKQNQS